VRIYKDNYQELHTWLLEKGNVLAQLYESELREQAQLAKVKLLNKGQDGSSIPVTLTLKKAIDRLKVPLL